MKYDIGVYSGVAAVQISDETAGPFSPDRTEVGMLCRDWVGATQHHNKNNVRHLSSRTGYYAGLTLLLLVT